MNRYLQFSNVGRSKFSGKKLLHPEISHPDEIAEVAFLEARKHLMSRDVNCVYDLAKNKGSVFAGVRTVGSFSIIESKTK